MIDRRRLVAENANSNWIDLFYAVNYGGLNNKVLLGIRWKPYAPTNYYWSLTQYRSNYSYNYINLSVCQDPVNNPDGTMMIQLASALGSNLGFGQLPVYGEGLEGGEINYFNHLDENAQYSYFSSHFDGTWVTYMIQDATEYFIQQLGFFTSANTGVWIASVSAYGIGVSDEHYAEVLVEDA